MLIDGEPPVDFVALRTVPVGRWDACLPDLVVFFAVPRKPCDVKRCDAKLELLEGKLDH
jgi:hypothetical protein